MFKEGSVPSGKLPVITVKTEKVNEEKWALIRVLILKIIVAIRVSQASLELMNMYQKVLNCCFVK